MGSNCFRWYHYNALDSDSKSFVQFGNDFVFVIYKWMGFFRITKIFCLDDLPHLLKASASLQLMQWIVIFFFVLVKEFLSKNDNSKKFTRTFDGLKKAHVIAVEIVEKKLCSRSGCPLRFVAVPSPLIEITHLNYTKRPHIPWPHSIYASIRSQTVKEDDAHSCGYRWRS